MKHVISVSVDEETLISLKKAIRENPSFRNTSHFVEFAIQKYLEGEE